MFQPQTRCISATKSLQVNFRSASPANLFSISLVFTYRLKPIGIVPSEMAATFHIPHTHTAVPVEKLIPFKLFVSLQLDRFGRSWPLSGGQTQLRADKFPSIRRRPNTLTTHRLLGFLGVSSECRVGPSPPPLPGGTGRVARLLRAVLPGPRRGTAWGRGSGNRNNGAIRLCCLRAIGVRNPSCPMRAIHGAKT